MRCFVLTLALLLGTCPVAWAGPYPVTGMPSTDPAFVGWATGVVNLVRGPQHIADPSSPLASFGVATNALGVADGTFGVVSLGDGGQITLTFAKAIANGPGADFAVFENGFAFQGKVFAELAFVEVSANGIDFIRFPAVSLTPTSVPLGSFGLIDPSDIHNLAGQFPALQGTPFDLSDVGLNVVTHVRIIDVIGSLETEHRRLDSLGNPINDPYPTPFASSGFDLDAVGVIHQVPAPSGFVLLTLGGVVLGCSRLYRRR